MKRTKKAEKDIKGIVMNLSDVYEVEFTENAGNGSIAKGEKKFVTLPIAVKLYNKGKVKLNAETLAKAKELKLPLEEKAAKAKNAE